MKTDCAGWIELPKDERSAMQKKNYRGNVARKRKTFVIFTIDVYHLHAFQQYLIFDIWAKPIDDF